MGMLLLLAGLLIPTAHAQEGPALIRSASTLRPLTLESREGETEVFDALGRPINATLLAELQGHDELADAVRQSRSTQRMMGWSLFSGGAVVLLAGAAGTDSWNEDTQARGRWAMLAGAGLVGTGSAFLFNRKSLRVSSWYSEEALESGVQWVNAQPLQRWTEPHLRVLDDQRHGWRLVDEAGSSWNARDLALASGDPRAAAIFRRDRGEVVWGILGCTVGGYLLLVGSTLTIVGATVEPQNGLWVAGTVATIGGGLVLGRSITRLRHQPKRHVTKWYTREEAQQWAEWLNANPRTTGRPGVNVDIGVAPVPQGIGAGVNLTW